MYYRLLTPLGACNECNQLTGWLITKYTKVEGKPKYDTVEYVRL